MDTTLGSFAPSATGASAGAGAGGRTQQLWKTHDAKANKTGPHHTVFWAKSDKAFAESKRLGVPPPKGTAKYTTGSKYAGSWRDNKKEGYGTLTKPTGDQYEGEWLDDKRHGRGTQWVKRGGKLRKVYTGDWYMGKRSGVGVYFYKNGDRYEGDWDNNKRHGRGRMEFADGDVYDGAWVDDEREGVGALILANGDQYEGHWKHNKKEGPGRFFYMSTLKMYEGEWVDDVAKCGVFSDIPTELLDRDARTRASEDKFTLPELGLADPDAVVEDAVDAACRWRVDRGASAAAAGGGAGSSGGGAGAGSSSATLSADELDQLRTAFLQADTEDTGSILGCDLPIVLAHLGISPSSSALEGLLEELGATHDTPLTFDAFADCMAKLRE